MSIQMLGIDHVLAPVAVRELFSFTKKNMAETMPCWKELPGIGGVIILSTCNRLEIWVSTEEESEEAPDLLELLCREKQVAAENYESYAVRRKDHAAVEHLFSLACGLESRILGEDQIITQVKDALAFSRDVYCTDHVLEVLFRMAVTAAKKVKTEVNISGSDVSVIHHAVASMKQEGYNFSGKRCMVIGNGEMGKLSANVLVSEGALVTVTVRQYRSGHVEIPRGCSRIDYSERLSLLPECDFVVSATASPNYTLNAEMLSGADRKPSLVLIDLAVPRDIDPAVAELPDVTLFDVDHFQISGQSEQVRRSIAAAYLILDEHMEEFFDWYEGRDLIEQIGVIKKNAAEDFYLRMQKQARQLERLCEDENVLKAAQQLENSARRASDKVINKLIFGLKGNVSDHTFRECVEALKQVFSAEAEDEKK
ncbi:MAG: glutamyl-tRNA reductase [Eubacteriales bacterium]|nr:glutamyl-tRNA reductase [Eubacteriales bacterium]